MPVAGRHRTRSFRSTRNLDEDMTRDHNDGAVALQAAHLDLTITAVIQQIFVAHIE